MPILEHACVRLPLCRCEAVRLASSCGPSSSGLALNFDEEAKRMNEKVMNAEFDFDGLGSGLRCPHLHSLLHHRDPFPDQADLDWLLLWRHAGGKSSWAIVPRHGNCSQIWNLSIIYHQLSFDPPKVPENE